MTALTFAAPGTATLPLYLVRKEDVGGLLDQFEDTGRRWIEATGFNGSLGETLLLPGKNGDVAGAIAGARTVSWRGQLGI